MKKNLLISLLAAGMLTLTNCGHAPKEEATGQHNIKLTKVTDYMYETTLDYDFDYSKAIEIEKQYGVNSPLAVLYANIVVAQTKVALTLQWSAQAQFTGYYVAQAHTS